MPRATLPPTPIASTEIQGKDDSLLLVTEKAFDLGPPALSQKQSSTVSSTTKHPQTATNTNFTLPPPPTRSRTIIQMKPKPQSSDAADSITSQRSLKGAAKRPGSGSAVTNGSGKRQPSATSVAGKRIARKTAHSVIERRRRSKMNEEFATLKGMIPACTDQEMHKLAILQASIDYLQYLEKCIEDLKAANNSLSTPLLPPEAPPPRLNTEMLDEYEDDQEGEVEDQDVAMSDTGTQSRGSPSFSTAQSHTKAYKSPGSITPSPALEPQHQYQGSSYASSASTLPSPAFGPQDHRSHTSQSQTSLSASTSPTMMPSPEQDQEATAALLMLNKDRRNPKAGRGLSVKDLLSS